MARRNLLAIDGGGLHGILPLCALVRLEQTTGRLARDTFSFVAGTSAGAIIAAGIAAGIPAPQLLDQFMRTAGQVFVHRPWNLLTRLVAGHMYSTSTLHAALTAALGPHQDWTMNDAPIDLLITAVRVVDGKPWYFVRDQLANSGRTGHLRLVDCVTASAAAPTFFAPWTMPEDPAALRPGDTPIGALVDGGVTVTGNPVYQACVEAFYYTGSYLPEKTLVVSLGTGHFPTVARPTWLGSWLGWLLDEMLRSPNEQQTDIVSRHFPQTPLYRLDPDLHALDPTLTGDIPLDDVRQMDRLRGYGEQFAAGVDWAPILAGADSPFRVHRNSPQWYQHTPRPLPRPPGPRG